MNIFTSKEKLTSLKLGIYRAIVRRWECMEKDKSGKESDPLQLKNKMKALARFGVVVAHDLNNCLMAITLNGQLMLKELPEGDPHKEDLKEIIDAGQKAALLSRQVQGWVPQGSPEKVVIDATEILKEISKNMQEKVGKRIQINLTLPSTPVFVMCAKERLEMALECLVDNVADFSTDGSVGEIGVEIQEKEAIIFVNDNGPGIDPAILDLVAEPFYTTKPKGKGRGLGLAIAYGVVAERNGLMKILSEPTKGTRVELRFPLAQKPS